MYSGITRGLYPVVAVDALEGVTCFNVELDAALTQGLEIGASVSVDGVCLTVVKLAGHRVSFDAIGETLSRTTLRSLHEGREVSIERSCRVGDELGGHDVFGHVIGTGTVIAREHRNGDFSLSIGVPPAWMKYILHKGFIALDGSSLTVGDVRAAGSFDVHLIPETLRVTSFAKKQPGDFVNVELDSRTVAIVDTVERVLREREALMAQK